jgi:dihydrofolate reductase
LDDAVSRARDAAGDKEIVIMGGAAVVRESIVCGLADELRIHLSPVVVGGGTPLFGSGSDPVAPAPGRRGRLPYATLITYEIPKS